MGLQHVLFTREGGFLLYGAVCGAAFGAARIGKRTGLRFSRVMDEITLPGLSAILLCRLGEGFAHEGLGTWVEDERYWRFPFAVQNAYGEYQWALFLLEALYALFMILFLRSWYAPSNKKDGIALSALLLYAAAQICFESLRTDSSLKIGFVRVSQVLSAAAILFVILIRNRKSKRALMWRILLCALCYGGIGAAEWALDKTEISAFALYAAMLILCFILVWAGHSKTRPQRKAA